MSEWRFEKVKDLSLEVKVGFVGSINEYYCQREEGIPIIRTTDIGALNTNDFKFVTNQFHLKNKKSQLKKGDLIIARHGENGKAMVFVEDYEAQVLNAVIIKPDPSKIDSFLLKYFFEINFIKKQINGDVKGSVQGVVNTAHIANVLIPFSKKIDYNNVKNTLYNIDHKIELNNKINAELEAMAKTIYDYWFVQFDFPDANGKPYRSSGGAMVYNETLKREIPEGWKTGKFSEYIDFIRGISYTSSTMNDSNGIPMINLKSFNLDGTYRQDGLKYFTGKLNDSKLISSQDLLIAITDVTREAEIIGRAILVPDFNTKIVCSCDVAKIDIISPKLKKNYLRYLFNSEYYHEYIKCYATGTLVLHLDLNGVMWYEDVIPSITIQEKFEDLVDSINNKINANLKQNQELASLRDWLLPMLMNGQVGFKN